MSTHLGRPLFSFPLENPPSFQAGEEVWIGDPCYVIEPWSDFCGQCSASLDGTTTALAPKLTSFHERVLDSENPRVWPMIYWSTAYGDGCYPLRQHGGTVGECGVDAGMLSIIPMRALQGIDRAELERLGVIVRASASTPRIEGGDLHWGGFTLFTSEMDGTDEEPEDEPEEDEEADL